MTPDERAAVVRLAERFQYEGDLMAWVIDETASTVEFLAPDDADLELFPTSVGTVTIQVTLLPRPEEY